MLIPFGANYPSVGTALSPNAGPKVSGVVLSNIGGTAGAIPASPSSSHGYTRFTVGGGIVEDQLIEQEPVSP